MTEVQRCIIIVSIMGTILSEYDDDEITPSIQELKDVCESFMNKQSGVELLPRIGYRITNKKRHEQFKATIKIGDRIWQASLDRYAKKSITIDAVSIVSSLYYFFPTILHKHTRINKQRMDAFQSESFPGDEESKKTGVIVGGYLMELLGKEMGYQFNGPLRALRQKIEREVAA